MAQMTNPQLTVISLGAGVQSTTVALMATYGELTPMPDCAIFADTGWEPKAVYEHLAKLEKALPFPVHRVSAGNLRQYAIDGRAPRTGNSFSVIPWFTGAGLGRRQCTANFKIEPLARKQRELLGPRGKVEVWIGISLDEAIRMKPARNRWQTNRWPLVEKRMTRRECQAWLAAHAWSAPKSSCIGCPYHSDNQWRELRSRPDEWADAVAVDRAIRSQRQRPQFMHRSLKPLDEVDLSPSSERARGDLFGDECAGLCGV
jgi:hypothetical protein